jgi:hypothetical protein
VRRRKTYSWSRRGTYSDLNKQVTQLFQTGESTESLNSTDDESDEENWHNLHVEDTENQHNIVAQEIKEFVESNPVENKQIFCKQTMENFLKLFENDPKFNQVLNFDFFPNNLNYVLVVLNDPTI